MSENLSKIIPYVHIDNSHFVTSEGRIGTVIECSGRNMGVMSKDEAESLTTSYGSVLNRLSDDMRLQVIATNHPMDADEWVPVYMRQYADCPPSLKPVRNDYERRLRQKLEGSHLPMLRYFVCPSLKLPSKRGVRGKTLRRNPHLHVRERDYERLIGKLLGISEALSRMLENELGVHSRQLLQGEMLDLLRSFISPHWHNVHRLSPGAVESGIAGAQHRDGQMKKTTLHEALGMGALDRYQDHIAVDTLRVRTLSLTDYPESTRPGWLKHLMSLPVSWRLVVDIEPLDSSREMAHLKRQLRMVAADNAPLDPGEHHNELAKIMKLLSFDPENVHRQANLEEFMDLLSTTDQRPFRVSAHIAITSETRKQLDRDTKLVIDSLSTDGSSIVDKRVLEQVPAWLTTLPGVIAAESWRTPTRNLGDTFPMIHNHAGTPSGMLLGWSEPGGEVVLFDPWGEHTPNALMTASGKGGAGKTTLAQTMALHIAMRGLKSIVFDHSDTAHWQDLASVIGGKHFFVSTDGEISINPFELRDEDLRTFRQTGQVPSTRRMWLTKLLGLMTSENGYLDPDQRAVADEAVNAVYSGGNPKPHLSELQAKLLSRNDPVAQTMARRLSPYVGSGTYAPFIDRDSNLDDSLQMVVFNFSRVDTGMVEVAMALLFDYVLGRLRQSRERAFMPIDEGWAMLRTDIMSYFVELLGKKSRHTTAAVLAMTQDLDDFAKSPAAQSIVNNASVNFLLQHEPSKYDSIQDLFKLTDAEIEIVSKFGRVPNSFETSDFGSNCWLNSRSGVEKGRVRLWVTPEEYWLTTSAAQVKDEISIRRLTIEEMGDTYSACRALARQETAPRVAVEGVG